MQCVRILWPLSPGQFKAPDKAVDLSRKKGYDRNILLHYNFSIFNEDQVDQIGIQERDQLYVLSFHNISGYRPSNYVPTHYPIDRNSEKYIKTIHSIKS